MPNEEVPAQLARAIQDADKGAVELPEGASITKIVPSISGDPKKGIYRISVAVPPMPPMLPSGFTFNQFLVVDEKTLLYHTGMKGLFPAVSAAVSCVLPVAELAYVGYAHAEADECGGMNAFLEVAPKAVPIASAVEAATYGSDQFLRTPLALADGQVLDLGEFKVQYMWTPHTPHGWGTGFLYEVNTKTLFAGDLLTQHGQNVKDVQEAMDIKAVDLKLFDITDYWVWHSKSRAHLYRLAALQPQTLLVMHGSSFKGSGCADMLLQLAELREGMETTTPPEKQPSAVTPGLYQNPA